MGFYVAPQPPSSPNKLSRSSGGKLSDRAVSRLCFSPSLHSARTLTCSTIDSNRLPLSRLSIDDTDVDILPTPSISRKKSSSKEADLADSHQQSQKYISNNDLVDDCTYPDLKQIDMNNDLVDLKQIDKMDALEKLQESPHRPFIPQDHSLRSLLASDEFLEDDSIPSSPLKSIGSKISWCDMNGSFVQVSEDNWPSSPLHKIGKQLSWSNMGQLGIPLEDPSKVSEAPPSPSRKPRSMHTPNIKAMQINSMDTKYPKTRERRKSYSSPVKPIAKKPLLCRAVSATASRQKDNRTNSPKKGSRRAMSLRNLLESSSDQVHPPSPIGKMVKKLSLRSLCGGSIKADSDPSDDGLSTVSASQSCRAGKLSRHLSLNRFDCSGTVNDTASETEKSYASSRSRSPVRSILQKASSFTTSRFSYKTSTNKSSAESWAPMRKSPGRCMSPRRSSCRKIPKEEQMLMKISTDLFSTEKPKKFYPKTSIVDGGGKKCADANLQSPSSLNTIHQPNPEVSYLPFLPTDNLREQSTASAV